MGLRINTNVASIQAQNGLAKTSKKLNQALTRLSTGLRINSGKDDVVGLANSEVLRAQIRGAGVARTNITSASAVMGVAEGYLSQLTEIAQNMRDLAVQAADDTLSESSRDAIKNSLNLTLSEYNRLTAVAEFNGVKLIDGSFAGKSIQAGTNEGDTINLSIDDARSGSIGKVAIYTAQTRSDGDALLSNLNLVGSSSIQINGVPLNNSDFTTDGVSYVEADESAIAYVQAINAHTATSGVTATVLGTVITLDYTAGVSLASSFHMLINGVTVKSNATAYATGGGAPQDAGISELVSLINAQSGETGVVATQDAATDDLVLTANDGRNVVVEIANAGAAATNVFNVMAAAETAIVYRGTFKLTSDDPFTITGATAEFTALVSQTATLDANTTLSNVSVDTADEAGTAISILDKVIAQLQEQRASVGNVATRLDMSESELASRIENLSSAESLIRDADVAAETAKYTMYNVLQQIGASVMAQANATPQIALTLLQNL